MNWVTLKSLNEVYQHGRTKIKRTLRNDSGIKLILGTKELIEIGDYYVNGTGFEEYYERYHLENFQSYHEFLDRRSFLKPQTRFEEDDIKILIDIESRMISGELIEIRDQMIKAEESVRGVSSMFFRNEKYLLKKDSLIDVVKSVLGIPELADEKDQQYKYVLECKDPKAIVLCENLDFLKKPSKPRKNNLELWYAGGKNIAKLDYVDLRGLPIFYSCDWDYDGLLIFQMVKEKIPEIKLLFPNALSKDIEETDHDSLWKRKNELNALSELNHDLFSEKYQARIKELIELNHWIIEEDNNLVEMVSEQFC